MKKMESESVDFILTDVPYDISKKNNFKSIKNYTKKTE
jgi:DNA modification methylase